MSEDKDAYQRDVEDDGMEDVKHFLAEPGNHVVSVDEFFREDKSPKLIISQSESVTDIQGGHNDEKLQVKMSQVSNVDINGGIGPSTACDDYLIGGKCEEIPRKGLSFEKSSSETHSSGSESSTIGVSESSSNCNGKPGFKNRTNDSQDQEKEKIEQKSPIIYTSQNRRKLLSKSHPSPLDTNLTSFVDLHRDSEEASIISNHRKIKQFSSARGSIVKSNDGKEDKPLKGFTESSSQKRSRNPPVRYIDEFTRYVSPSDERQRFCGAPMDKILSVKTSSKHDNGHKTLKSVKHARHKGHYDKSPNNLFAPNRDARGLSNRITVDISKEFSPVTRLDSDSEKESDSDTSADLARNGFKNSNVIEA